MGMWCRRLTPKTFTNANRLQAHQPQSESVNQRLIPRLLVTSSAPETRFLLRWLVENYGFASAFTHQLIVRRRLTTPSLASPCVGCSNAVSTTRIQRSITEQSYSNRKSLKRVSCVCNRTQVTTPHMWLTKSKFIRIERHRCAYHLRILCACLPESPPNRSPPGNETHSLRFVLLDLCANCASAAAAAECESLRGISAHI